MSNVCINMSEPKSGTKKFKSKNIRKNSTRSSEPRTKKKIMKRSLPDDGIAKSKQLVHKLQTTKSSSYGRPKNRTSKKDEEIRLCGNGKPMPSLSELEKMFEDSDNDGEETKETTPIKISTPTTPKKDQTIKPEEKLMSPATINEIANRMLHLVSNISNPTELLIEDGPPPPIIKPKKRKKPEEPYIVGCKERDYVPERPGVKFCKGDDKYGPDSEDEDDDLPKKRAKRGKKVNISKSIFNAKSDEIAARLKECGGDSDGSSDSNKTVAYEYYTPINHSAPKSFSPLPSTSTDNETFVKNDQRFNESLMSEKLFDSNMEDDIQILEPPCETIEINDTVTSTNMSKLNGSIIEITDDGPVPTFDDKIIASNTTTINIKDEDSLHAIDIKPALDIYDDCVQVVDVKPASPIPIDDYYGNLDMDNIPDDDICEVIDVDDIIAENKAIIEKYSKTNNLDTVTLVDTSTIQSSTIKNNHLDKVKDNDQIEVLSDTDNSISTNMNINSEPSTNNFVNDGKSITPNVQYNSNDSINSGVEIIDVLDDRNSLSVNSPQNQRAFESSVIDLVPTSHDSGNQNQESSASNVFRNNHTCNCNPENRSMTAQQQHNPQPTQCNNSQNSSCCNSTANNDSIQEYMQVLDKYFKSRLNGERPHKHSKRKTKNSRLNKDMLSQQFLAWWNKKNNGTPSDLLNSRSSLNNSSIQSPASTTSTDSPDKTSKRIGDCPICMDSLSNKPIVSTICGHVFCMECIKLSIRSNGNKCPTCRKALKKGTGYHQIFL